MPREEERSANLLRFDMIMCLVRAETAADWTALPDLVLELILDKLDSSKTCLRFVLVCKSWGSSVFRSCPHKFRSKLNKLIRHPMLLIGDKHVFSAFTGRVFPLDPVIFCSPFSQYISKYISVLWNQEEDGNQSVIIGSSFGWFFICNSYGHPKVKMIDSRFPKIIPLDHPITNDPQKHGYTQLIGSRPVKAVTTMDPDPYRGRIDNVLAIWFTSSSSTDPDHLLLLETSFMRLHRSSHQSRIPTRGRLHEICSRIVDIASIDSTVFCLHTMAADLYISRVSKLLGQPVCGRLVLYEDRLLKAKLPTPALSRYCRAYLVGSDDSSAPWPWLVIRHKTINRDGNMSTVGFQVFEEVRSIRGRKQTPNTEFSFVRVSKLQNDVLFISRKSAFRIAAGSGLIAAFGLLEPNTVYYLDDGYRENGSSDPNNMNTVSYLDMGVFDMEHGCRRPFPIPEHTKQLLSSALMKHHSPLWFLN